MGASVIPRVEERPSRKTHDKRDEQVVEYLAGDEKLRYEESEGAEDHDAAADAVGGAPCFRILEGPWGADAGEIIRADFCAKIADDDEEDEACVEGEGVHGEGQPEGVRDLDAEREGEEEEEGRPEDSKYGHCALAFLALRAADLGVDHGEEF